MPITTGSKLALYFYAVALALVAALHLLAQLVAADEILAYVTQILLMPLLFGALYSGTTAKRPRLVRLVLIAVVFSWLGDTVPRFMGGDRGFLVMVGFFLVAQLFYIAALWPFRCGSVAGRTLPALPYFAVFAALVLACAPGAGVLLVPVVIYGLALVLMAMLSTGLGSLAGVGGAIFLISDGLIALRSFTAWELPALSFWIMLSYVMGQGLITVAVVRHTRRPHP
ncbi:lysoplasmalogenase [Paeniglutamicibacter terrestris]|uniref:Lysoplasmalogenase n=1 Tax=Paeniglutamicibacter terrestris TaxID=2723403 RepID=A0ABX1G9R0_9MICC|nr:lysoplasmalogenase [Paeniglutamicibacter terrestris]NKG22426.1 lysoplasmalogenase [Paeniglutamicibacter terrestris]